MKEIKTTVKSEYLNVIKKNFANYKSLGDNSFEQLDENEVLYKPDSGSNSIAILIQHLAGNMISRFTNFLESDGEKPGRNRDAEFEEHTPGKKDLLQRWEQGWKVLDETLESLSEDDLVKIVLIRNEPHSVIEALNRQLAHYAYHVGQIVLLAKMIKKEKWQTLSIPKGKSKEFNERRSSKKV